MRCAQFGLCISMLFFAGATAANAQTSAYVDPRFGFTLQYPRTATINKSDFRPQMTAALDVSFNLTLPPAMLQPTTNLEEAAVFIGVSADPAVVSMCKSAIPSRGEKASGLTTIAGEPFARFTVFDGAAGSMGESTIYRTVHAGACYELTEFLYYYDLGAFAPGTVQPFEEAKVKAVLGAITHSFAFAP